MLRLSRQEYRLARKLFRIQGSSSLNGSANRSNSRGAIYAQMTQNILSHIASNHVYRIDVNFKIEEK